ncbi:MAG: permease prefix domain 1-containing protein [Spirochaetales bacterium]
MNRKITAYLDILFADIPKSKQAIELKAELSANLNDRMNDYMHDGKSENQAYSLAIASLGEVDELFSQLPKGTKPTEEISHRRTLNAVLRACAITLYILSIVPVIILDKLPVPSGIGFVGMLGMIAVATGLLIFIRTSTPPQMASATIQNSDNNYDSFEKTKANNRFKSISSLVWSVATLLFFVLGFVWGEWGRIWVLFPIAGISLGIYKSIIQLTNGDSDNA